MRDLVPDMNIPEMTNFANSMDTNDPLASFRSRFHLPGAPESPDIYFLGNSLGLQPKSTSHAIESVLAQWAEAGVDGHFRGQPAWMDLPELVSAEMANIVGAHADEVVVMNSLTVNLHLMMATFYQPTDSRNKILIERHAFPSDHQAVVSHLEMRGFSEEQSLVLVGSQQPGVISTQEIIDTIERHRDSLALILLPGVQYYTGQLLDLVAITDKARELDIPIGFDLAHAAGNVPLELHACGADFACWCTYKYLNAGPGALGGCFIHRRHANNQALPRLAGWWGHERKSRFEMKPEFVPEASALGWQQSNPPILAMVPIMSSLEIFKAAGGMPALRKKSLQLTGYFRRLLEDLARTYPSIRILTPAAAEESGCQLSFELDDSPARARRLFDDLLANQTFVDWREPNVVRAAPVPLYNSFRDVERFVGTLGRCLG